MLETPSSSLSQIEHQEVNLDDFLKILNISQNKCKKINELEKISKRFDEDELCICEDFFNNKISYDLCINQLTQKQSETANQHEVKLYPNENIEKEKLVIYSKLADLSYIHLKTNPAKAGNESFEFQTVSLDPSAFEHLNTIFDNPNIATLTEDEIFLYNYINEHKDSEVDYEIAGNNEIESILDMAGLDKQLLASNIGAKGVYDGSKALKRFLLLMGLNKLVENKEKKAEENFDHLKQDFEILDYFPNEVKGDKDSSGFGAVFLEKDGKKYIAIRGTEGLSDWKDLFADVQMIGGNIPAEQTKAMTEFIDRCIMPGEKFSVVGHSLGGTLSQIATAMYMEQIRETYTFGGPGAKNLNVADDELSKFAKFKDFVHNRDSKEVGDLITNVEGAKGISLITDLGEDIGSYTIELKYLSSHSITEMIKYIEKLPSNSPEFKKIETGKKIKNTIIKIDKKGE